MGLHKRSCAACGFNFPGVALACAISSQVVDSQGYCIQIATVHPMPTGIGRSVFGLSVDISELRMRFFKARATPPSKYKAAALRTDQESK